MDRQAFRNRMQQLKQYREQNPGKTYLDFKKYANGGETGEDEKQWLMNWYTKRRLYANQKARYINKQLDVIEKYLVTPSSNANVPTYRVGLDKIPIVINDAKVKKLDPNAKAYYQPNEGIILSKDYKDENRENLLHEMVHSVNRYGSATGQHINSLIRGTKVYDLGKYTNYLTEPNEIYSRLMEFRKLNNMDPLKTYGKPDIERLRKTGKDVDLLNLFPDDDVILDLLNTTAAIKDKDINKVAEGGEIPPSNKPIIPEEPQPYKGKLYKDRYGRKYTEDQMNEYYDSSTDEIDRFTGKPFIRGLKPVGDIEDAANATPVGDAISAYDTYKALKNKDWEGAGLAAMGLIPFMPMTVKQFRSSYRGTKPKIKRPTPTVKKDATQKAIDQYMEQLHRNKMSEYDYLSDVANESNRIFESINTVPYRSRAIAADKTFGTNYNSTYDILDDLYEKDYFSLPEISGEDMGNVTARMQANEQAAKRFITTRQGATPRDFEFKVNVNRRGAPDELATHELNHYTDYAISKHSNTAVNNNMLQQLEGSLKEADPTSIDSRRRYLRSGTEQKAYMNTLRRRMLNDGTIKNIDDQVSTKLLNNYIDQLSDSDYIKKAYKEHKNISSYTKWFNSIPLLSVGALGVYGYENTNE